MFMANCVYCNVPNMDIVALFIPILVKYIDTWDAIKEAPNLLITVYNIILEIHLMQFYYSLSSQCII